MKLNCSYFLDGLIPQNIYLALASIVIFLFVLLFLWLLKNKYGVVPLLGTVLIIAGGVGNLAERLINGCVRDYIDFFGFFHFNLFDLFVTLGISVTILTIWKRQKAL